MDLIVFQSLGLKKFFYHPFVSLWFFCLILFLLDFLCNFALLIINIITKILSSIQSIHWTVLSDNLEHYQLIRLQEIHSALLLQQEEILCHLADIEDHIQHLTWSDSNIRNELHQTYIPISSLSESEQTVQLNATPLKPWWWQTIHQTRIGEPYSLLFSPLRTPEEECCNSIITWVNELRSHNYSQHGDPKWRSNASYSISATWKSTSNFFQWQMTSDNFNDLNNAELQVLVT